MACLATVEQAVVPFASVILIFLEGHDRCEGRLWPWRKMADLKLRLCGAQVDNRSHLGWFEGRRDGCVRGRWGALRGAAAARGGLAAASAHGVQCQRALYICTVCTWFLCTCDGVNKAELVSGCEDGQDGQGARVRGCGVAALGRTNPKARFCSTISLPDEPCDHETVI